MSAASRGRWTVAGVLLIFVACGQKSPSPPIERIDGRPGLRELIRVSPRLWSGAEPAGEAAFAQLRRMGIEHIISVDGVPPDRATAARFGLTYLHLPVGYDGIPAWVWRRLGEIASSQPGPIYIHCHHGKHRGPAVAAALAIVREGFSPDQALSILSLAGTSRDYPGLWRAIESPPDWRGGDRVAAAEPPPNPLAAAMARIDRLFDQLQFTIQNDVDSQATPGTDFSSAAVLLAEEWREIGRMVTGKPAEFHQQISEALEHTQQLQRLTRGSSAAEVRRLLGSLKKRCDRCHQQYRNGNE